MDARPAKELPTALALLTSLRSPHPFLLAPRLQALLRRAPTCASLGAPSSLRLPGLPTHPLGPVPLLVFGSQSAFLDLSPRYPLHPSEVSTQIPPSLQSRPDPAYNLKLYHLLQRPWRLSFFPQHSHHLTISFTHSLPPLPSPRTETQLLQHRALDPFCYLLPPRV